MGSGSIHPRARRSCTCRLAAPPGRRGPRRGARVRAHGDHELALDVLLAYERRADVAGRFAVGHRVVRRHDHDAEARSFLPTIDLRYVFFCQIQVMGSTMGPKGDLFRVLALVAEGKLRPVVDRVMPLWSVADAHRALEERKVFGKIVLEVD